jgi:hypothetical protein
MRNGIRVVVGPVAMDEFKVYAEDGEDLTDKLHVKSVRVEASATALTTVHLECYGEVDARGVLSVDALPRSQADRAEPESGPALRGHGHPARGRCQGDGDQPPDALEALP